MIRIKVIFLFIMIKSVFSQEGNYCTTPLGDPGICIMINRCGALVSLLKSDGYNPEVLEYLRRSTCGYTATSPLICCARIQSQFRTTQPPNTRPPQTRPPPPPVTQPPVVTPSRRPTGPGIGTGGTGTGGFNNVTTGNIGNGALLRLPECGRSGSTVGRVVGGVDAKLGDFPWLTVLGYKNNKNPSQPKWLCGGSLITSRHILTAGHCVHNRPDLYLARVGDLDIYSDDDGANPETINLVKAKVHENYSPTTFTNDIAILTLERSVQSPSVWPICLPFDEPWRTKDIEKNNLFVAGWGALYFNGPSSSLLQKLMMPVVPNGLCKNAFANFKTVIDERVMCAGYVDTGSKDACQGDSGGPLMKAEIINSKAYFIQYGIVSYGFRCAEVGYPGVYTRVTYFVDWIERNVI